MPTLENVWWLRLAALRFSGYLRVYSKTRNRARVGGPYYGGFSAISAISFRRVWPACGIFWTEASEITNFILGSKVEKKTKKIWPVDGSPPARS
jgi:hypothetical protein